MKVKHLLVGAVVSATTVGLLLWQCGGDSGTESASATDSSRDDLRAGGANIPTSRRPYANIAAQPPAAPAYGNAPNYPPGSRPLDPQNRHDMFPNAGAERITLVPVRAQPMAAGDGAGEDLDRLRPQNQPRYVFRADKLALVGNDVLRTTLEVFDGDPEAGAKRVPVTILEGSLTTRPQPGDPGRKLSSMTYNDDGRDGDVAAGDGIYTSRINTENAGLGDESAMFFPVVEFSADGIPRTVARISFRYTPQEQAPAEFTGAFRDSLADGSLRVDVDLLVRKPGYYLIDGYLFTGSLEPIGAASFRGELDIGRKNVSLTFYGLMFREKKLDGPYVLRFVKGHLANPGAQPDREDMPTFSGNYETADYPSSSFTDAPWTGGGFGATD